MEKLTHHGWQLPTHDTLRTIPSFITLVRTLFSAGFCLYAITSNSLSWLLVALATYWLGDTLDGMVARITNRETRSGAIFDIMGDRLCASLIYLTFGFWHQELLWAIGIYLVEFIFIDGFLSLIFLFWPLLSPNYFFLIDKRIFKLNWSPIGKFCNSTIFLLATLLLQNIWISLSIALVILFVKCYSIWRTYVVLGIPIPDLAAVPSKRSFDWNLPD